MASIVIVGAGTGGAATARALRGRLGGKHRITLVEQKPDLTYQPGLLWLMTGRRRQRDITRRTDRMRAGGADVVASKALALDTHQQTVRLENGRTLRYDTLVLAPGADASRADNQEVARAGFNLYTPAGALAIREAAERFRGGRIAILVTALPVKCPPAVYEAGFLLREGFEKKGLGKAVEISIYTPEQSPMQAAGPGVGRAFTNRLRKKGIGLHLNQRFLRVDPASRTLHFASGPVPYDLLIYVPRHQAPAFIAETDLPDQSGWIPVDPHTLRTREPGVYAIGDVNRIPLASGFDAPKTGAAAHFQALVVAENIAREMQGQNKSRLYGGKSLCVVEVGATAFSYFGDLDKPTPKPLIMPESRLWLAGKVAVERVWLHEHN